MAGSVSFEYLVTRNVVELLSSPALPRSLSRFRHEVRFSSVLMGGGRTKGRGCGRGRGGREHHKHPTISRVGATWLHQGTRVCPSFADRQDELMTHDSTQKRINHSSSPAPRCDIRGSCWQSRKPHGCSTNLVTSSLLQQHGVRSYVAHIISWKPSKWTTHTIRGSCITVWRGT